MLALNRMQDIRSRYPANDDLMQSPRLVVDNKKVTTEDLRTPFVTYSKQVKKEADTHNSSIDNSRHSALSQHSTINNTTMTKGEKVNAYIAGKQVALTKQQLDIARKQSSTLTQISGLLKEMNNFQKAQAKKMDPKYQRQSSFNAHAYSYDRQGGPGGAGSANDSRYDGKPKDGGAFDALGAGLAAALGLGAGAVGGKSIWDRIKNRRNRTGTPRPGTPGTPGTPPRPNTPPARGGWARRAQDAWRATAGVKGGRGALLTRGAAVVAAGVGINQALDNTSDPLRGLDTGESVQPQPLFMPESGTTRMSFPDMSGDTQTRPATQPNSNTRSSGEVQRFEQDRPRQDINRGSNYGNGLGSVSQGEESRRGVFEISSGRGDHGGVSYGAHQLSSATGTMRSFLLSEQGRRYAPHFAGLTPGTPQFNDMYTRIAQHDPQGFAASQKEYIDRTHYKPVHDRLRNDIGVDISNRGRAVQEMVYSTSVQYGPATTVIRNALMGKDANSMSDAELIRTVQQYKHDTVDRYFRSSSPEVRRSVGARALREKQTLLNLDRQEQETAALNQAPEDVSSMQTMTATEAVVPRVPYREPEVPQDDVVSYVPSLPEPKDESGIDPTLVAMTAATGAIGLAPLVGRAPTEVTSASPQTPTQPAPRTPPANAVQPTAPKATPNVPKPSRLGRMIPYANVGIGAYDAYSVLSDDTLSADEKKREMSGVVGGTAGAAGGAALGAAIGSAFFGIGAIPGAIIGGGLGMLGYGLGSSAGKSLYDMSDAMKPNARTMPVSTMDDPSRYIKPESGSTPVESRIPNDTSIDIMNLGAPMPRSNRPVPMEFERAEPARVAPTPVPVESIQQRREQLKDSDVSDVPNVPEGFTEVSNITAPLAAGISWPTRQEGTSELNVNPTTPAMQPKIQGYAGISSSYNRAPLSSMDEDPSNPVSGLVAGSFSAIASSILGKDVSLNGMNAGHVPYVTARSTPSTDSGMARTGSRMQDVSAGVMPSVDTPSSRHYYEDNDISTSASSVMRNNISPSRPTMTAGAVSSAGSYTQPAVQAPYEPVQKVMMLEPKMQETLMPARFKPEGERTPSQGVADSASSRQVIDDAPTVIGDSGLVLLHTGFI